MKENSSASSHGLCVGDQLELEIETLGYGGEGIATHRNQRVVVAHSLPGERVLAQVVRVPRGRAPRLMVRELLRASPLRIDPGCPWYDRCPGCQLRHVPYEYELTLKRESVAQALSKFAGGDQDCVAPALAAPERNNYRNKARGTVTGGGQITIRSMVPGGPPIPLRECPAQHPATREMIARLEAELAAGMKTCAPDSVVELNSALGEVAPGEQQRKNREGGKPPAREVLLGELRLGAGPDSWILPNLSMAVPLRDTVLSLLKPDQGDRIIELGCGIGGLTIPVAARGASMVAIDMNRDTMLTLEENLRLHHLDDRVVVRAGPVERVWKRLPGQEQGFTGALCNPMRQPLRRAAMETLVNDLGVKRVVYVGPSPVPAARDLGVLTGMGWTIRGAVPVDLYPGTYHVLTVALAQAP